MKSGDKVIMHRKKYLPLWLNTFAGYVINVYRKCVSVRVPVDDDRIHIISKDECEVIQERDIGQEILDGIKEIIKEKR